MTARIPGPGDEVTWPAYAGHPNDPRAPDEPEWGQMTRAEKAADLDANFSKAELIAMYLDEIEERARELAFRGVIAKRRIDPNSLSLHNIAP
jgi:transposase